MKTQRSDTEKEIVMKKNLIEECERKGIDKIIIQN